jgi:uncharacterized NAD(P)/FAD-binding protein YdhS
VIDYQPVQVGSIASMDRRDLVLNIVAVARTAMLYGVPVVLSTVNVKTGANQPTIHQLAEVLHGIEALDRTTINACEDAEFVDAVKATGRKKLLMTALWTEACLSFPTLDACERDTRSTRSRMPWAAHRSRHIEQYSSGSSRPVRSRRAGSRCSANCSATGRGKRPPGNSLRFSLQSKGTRR